MNNPCLFAPDKFFVLRAPALPFDILEGMSVGLLAPSREPAQLENAIETDKGIVRLRLWEAVRRPEVREALLLASPDLEAQLDFWLQGALPPIKCSRIERSVFRYLIRMASRPTPFGLFSGWSLGRWGESTDLSVNGWSSATRRTRLDMGYLYFLVEAMERDPNVRKTLTYRPNSSLYRAAGRFHYAEWRLNEWGERKYHLVALEDEEYLSATLDLARNGASVEVLAASLVDDHIPMEEAIAYVSELIENQVIVPELQPSVTGQEPILSVIEKLKSLDGTRHLAFGLERIRDAFTKLDAGGVGQDPALYHALGHDEFLPTGSKVRTLLQVDMGNVAPGAKLGSAVQEALVNAVDLIRRLEPRGTRDSFKSFKAAFEERYGSRWVPLMEALDEEIGVGFAANGESSDASLLLRGLPFPEEAGTETVNWGSREAFLLRRIIEQRGQSEWELNSDDLKALENPEPNEVPDSFAAIAKVSATSQEALDSGDFQIYLRSYFGPSGVKLLGRFCHQDSELESYVRSHLDAEAAFHPDAIFAEIVHLPEGGLGNFICRPQLRKDEISYLGVGSAAGDHQFQPQDLLVSVVGGRVTLRSKSLGKEVIPRLTSAHSYSSGLNVYQFLCRLQERDSIGAGWSWGPLESSAPFLPRVRRGRHILARARWRLEEDELEPVFAAGEKGWFRAIQELRQARGLPRFVVLVEPEMTLLLDMENALWLEAFLQYVAKRGALTLEEFFPGPEEMRTQHFGERYVHELLVPFLKNRRSDNEPPSQKVESRIAHQNLTTPVLRTFAPGSEWLFLKIYTGGGTADQLLSREVRLFLESTKGIWDRWFFIRYSDPDEHIRLRFHGDPALLAGELLPLFHAAFGAFLKTGHFWKVQIDTYQREVERYGGPSGIALAEDIFCIDSEAMLDLLSAYPGDEGAEARWQLGLKAADMILVDMDLNTEERAAIFSESRHVFGQEFKSKGLLDIELGKRFRGVRKDLDSLLFNSVPNHDGLLEGIRILTHRSERLASPFHLLDVERAEGRLTVSKGQMARSFVHMTLNRLLRSSQRRQEFVIYDFLNRLYHSRLARSSGDPGKMAKP